MRTPIAITASIAVSLLASPSQAVQPIVPGLNQLVVIHPGAHERGLPAVRLERADASGNVVVDIPPTLHVHRFYYSGDQEYQGPIIQGGPIVVVANHPKTGERMYVDVTLPAGAPKIAYCKSGITYVYPNSRVALRFSHFHLDKVRVTYHSGRGAARRTHEIVKQIKEKPHYSTVAECVRGAADHVNELANVIPGYTYVTSFFQNRPERRNEAMIDKAQRVKESAELKFLPTNR